jgi:site-specific recombinase XerD
MHGKTSARTAMRKAIPRPPSFAALAQAFFAEHLQQQRATSPRTVAAYRDAFTLFLDFAKSRLRKQPTAMRLQDITPALILAFLDHLERERGNSVRSRNARLAALRAFLKFAGRRGVTALHVVEQALNVPMKRFERPIVGFLSREEMLSIIGEPGNNWTSQRDHLLLRMLYNTGARVSEVIAIKVADVVLDGAACVHLHGKGRKQRTVPLWRSTVKQIRAWLKVNPQFEPNSPLLPNRDGNAMTRNNVSQRVALAVKTATAAQPQLTKRRISPHTVRHTTAMHLLQSGVDITVIALWLGHESPVTTHHYVEADLAMKERALARLHEPDAALRRYRAPDSLVEFLKTL